MKTTALITIGLVAMALATSELFAGSATWDLNPASGDWNTATNWSPSTVPNGPSDTATFAFSNTTAVSLSANTEINGVVFNAAATNSFTITASPMFRLLISGTGITNLPGITQNFLAGVDALGNRGSIQFANSANAGNSTVFTLDGASVSGANGGVTRFLDNSTTGNSTFINNGGTVSGARGGITRFRDTSSAVNATLIANGGTVSGAGGGVILFSDRSFLTDGVTLIANGGGEGAEGGSIRFADEANDFSPRSLSTTRVKVFGTGNLDISLHAISVLIGSLEGDGNVFLGGDKTLVVGGNGLSSHFSGVIQGGGIGGGTDGSLNIFGSIMTLTGANTYTGGTTVGGTAAVGFINNRSGSGTGFGKVIALSGGTLGGNGAIAGPVSIEGGFTHDGFLSPGAIDSSTGTLTIQSTLTLLGGVFNFELNSDTGDADEVVANGVSITGLFGGESLFSFTDLGNSVLAIGTEFTVLENTSLSLIDGTFGNLRNGLVFTGDFNIFQVDYQGGDGNNLTLTVRNPANVPDAGTTLLLLTVAVSGLTLLRRMIA